MRCTFKEPQFQWYARGYVDSLLRRPPAPPKVAQQFGVGGVSNECVLAYNAGYTFGNSDAERTKHGRLGQ